MIFEKHGFWIVTAVFSLVGLIMMSVFMEEKNLSVHWQNVYRTLALLFVIIFLFSGTLAVVSAP